jgi:hypothetical protein
MKTKIVNFISGPGVGKCHGKNTGIIMFDGQVKMVQDIIVGDILMGDDSTPRTVCSLARGREMMYRIKCHNGDTFTVNENHVLCLKKCNSFEIVEITVQEYLLLDKLFKSDLKCYFTGIDFCEKNVDFNFNFNQLDFIPSDYKFNSRNIRLQFLAKIIYTFGHTSVNHYHIIHKSKKFAYDIVYLCKSLGLSTTIKEVFDYFKVTINIKINSLLNFDIEKIGVDDYYGFTIDHNHRYLLDNFIVSHNSTMSSLVYAELKMLHKSAEIVPEVAKWLIYREEFEKLNDQYFVSSEQYKQIKALDGKVEYVIGDSGIFSGLYYNRAYKSNMSDIQKTEQMILDKNNEFHNIYVYIVRNKNFPFEKEGRVHTEEESMIIDKEIKYLLDEYNIKYLSVLSDKTSIPTIMNYILSQ